MANDRNKISPSALVALGIVFGDIGTSPLYAFRESFLGSPMLETSDAHVLGVLSMIIWALTAVISVKYLLVVMRADNHGEGGIIALVALLAARDRSGRRTPKLVVALGLFGAALLYGDGSITPAISVLSALEGIQVTTHAFDAYVVPVAVLVLFGFFAFQHKGTSAIGAAVGPVMFVWFATIGLLGIRGIAEETSVLKAFNPYWAVHFIASDGGAALLVLGAVFLVVTGGEALYADMGQCGRRPIRIAWFAVVMPALLLNYLGQGALVLSNREEIHHPFFHLAPEWALYPVVALAIVATLIASQAVVSGVFSLTRQAIQLNQLPRISVIQTSDKEYGQVYIPLVNWVLMAASMALVIGFQSSSRLASAYGVAIATDMLITTVLVLFVFQRHGRTSILFAGLSFLILMIDIAFFGANLVKIPDGGWYPLSLGVLVFLTMTTWRRGYSVLREKLESQALPLEALDELAHARGVVRTGVPAAFLTNLDSSDVSPVLRRFVDHLGAMPQPFALIHVEVASLPRVPATDRFRVRTIGEDLYFVHIRYGFVQHINVPAVMRAAYKTGLPLNPNLVVYFLGRLTLVPPDNKLGMAWWQYHFFSFLGRNSHQDACDFGIPANQVMELGIQAKV